MCVPMYKRCVLVHEKEANVRRQTTCKSDLQVLEQISKWTEENMLWNCENCVKIC